MAIDQMALIDLLNNLRNQSPPPISPAAGATGSFMDMMQRTPPPQAVSDPRAAWEQQLFAPQQPDLLPEEPEMGRGKKLGLGVGSAIADALGAYASGLGSPVRANYSQQLLERIRAGQFARDENKRRLTGAEQQAQKARAGYKLGQIEKGEDQARQDKRFAAEQQARKDELTAKQEAEKAEMDRRMGFEAKQAELDAQRRIDLEVLKGQQDYKIEQLRQAGKETEDRVLNRQREGEQRASLKELKSSVASMKAQIPEMLKTQTPDQIREMYLDAVEVQGLEGPAKQEALEFFRDRLEPILMRYDPVQGPQDDPGARTRAQQRAGVQQRKSQGGYEPFVGRQ